jgi:Reverse transcriptase (RNA-dependent DNA polymerase)
LINRLPTQVLSWKTPYEILFSKSPTYDHLRVLGCLCYAHCHSRHCGKFDPRAVKCVFVGYPFGQKGYRVYDLETKKIFVSRDVVFHEKMFPFLSFILENKPPPMQPMSFDEPVPNIYSSLIPTVPQTSTLSDSQIQSHSLPKIHPNETQSTQLAMPRHSPRVHTRPSYLNDYVCSMAFGPPSTSSSLQEVLAGKQYPIGKHISYNFYSPTHMAFVASLSNNNEPSTYHQAIKDPNWRRAMEEEIKALEHNKTWTWESLPEGKKPIGCKWVFKIKYKPDGSIERYKARLVAKDYNQREGIDYNETFALVAKLVTVRCLLAVASARGWHLHQLDVNNVFLHGDLQEEVYMSPPSGFSCKGGTKVCRLQKSLYGLKQASRNWFEKFTDSLKKVGFKQFVADYSLFTLACGESFIAILVYVDDLIITGNNLSYISHLKRYLNDLFHLKDLGNLKYFLGIEVARSSEGVFCVSESILSIY